MVEQGAWRGCGPWQGWLPYLGLAHLQARDPGLPCIKDHATERENKRAGVTPQCPAPTGTYPSLPGLTPTSKPRAIRPAGQQ